MNRAYICMHMYVSTVSSYARARAWYICECVSACVYLPAAICYYYLYDLRHVYYYVLVAIR